MNEIIIKSKLVRAFQHLQDSSESYDNGCMLIKELIDLVNDSEKHAIKQTEVHDMLNTMSDQQLQLAKFYAVKTLDELINAQAEHIERLQSKLTKLSPSNFGATIKVREG